MTPHPDEQARERAEQYVRSCLEIMDGSAEAGIRRIGTDQYEQTVLDVMKTSLRVKRAAAAQPGDTAAGGER